MSKKRNCIISTSFVVGSALFCVDRCLYIYEETPRPHNILYTLSSLFFLLGISFLYT